MIKKIEIQDHNGDVYYPHTSADVVYMPDGSDIKTSILNLGKDKANTNHTHDDRYYTESEINTKFNSLSISNPNMLINGSFQVWQRGNNFLSGSGYTADRWKRYDYTPGIKILKNNKGMNLQSTGASQSILIIQCLDGEFLGSLWGKDITLSVEYKTYSGNPEILADIRYDKPLNNLGSGVEREVVNVKSKSGVKEGIISCTMKNLKYDKQTLIVGLTISNKEDTTNFSTIIKGVKLEIGDKATPIGEHNYTDELLMCKRYYDKCMISQSACVSDSGQLFVDLSTSVYDKRVSQPTVKFVGNCYAKLQSSGTPILLSNTNIFKYFGGLEIQNSSISAGRIYTVNADNVAGNNISAPGWVEIDAEIY